MFLSLFPGFLVLRTRSELLKLAVRVMIIQVRAGGGEDGCMLEDVFVFGHKKVVACWQLGIFNLFEVIFLVSTVVKPQSHFLYISEIGVHP